MGIDFDDTDDAYSLVGTDGGDLNTPSAFTVAFWLNPDALNTGDAFVNKVTAATNGWMIRTITAAQDFTFWFGDAGSGNINGRMVGGLAVGTLAHWACVFDGSGVGNAARCKIYRNGANQTLSFTGTIPAAPVTTAGQVILVAINGVTSQLYDGKMDNLMAWNIALSADQVAQQAVMRRPVTTTGLQFWFPMLGQDASGQILDASGRGVTTNKGGAPTLVQVAGHIGLGAPQMAS